MPNRQVDATSGSDAPPEAPRAAVSPPSATGLAHLAPCPACGALNGRSALACWDCEASLLTDQDLWFNAAAAAPAVRRPADRPAAAAHDAGDARVIDDTADDTADDPPPATPPAPARSSETESDFPVLTMAMAPNASAPTAWAEASGAASRQRPRRRLVTVAAAVGMLALGLAAVLLLETRHSAQDTADSTPGNVFAPAAPAVVATPAPTPSPSLPEPLDIGSLPPPAAGIPPPSEPPASAAVVAAATPAARSPARQRAPTQRSASPAPSRITVYEAPVPPPPAPLGPCTATIAALGLCAPAAQPPKDPP